MPASQSSIWAGEFKPKKAATPSNAAAQKVASRTSGHHESSSVSLEKVASVPTTRSTRKAAEPTTVPKPTSVPEKVPTSDVNSSGAALPAARSTAAASGGSLSRPAITSSAGAR